MWLAAPLSLKESSYSPGFVWVCVIGFVVQLVVVFNLFGERRRGRRKMQELKFEDE